jgi:hypothetical protein
MNTIWRFLLMIVLVSFAGCRTFDPHKVIDSPWSPSVLSKEGCPNLDGRYRGEVLALEFLSFSRKDYAHNRLDPNGPLTTVVHRLEPYLTSRKHPDSRGGYVADSVKEKIFESHAITMIQQRGRNIDVVSMDDAGVEYSTMTLKVDHPQIEYPYVGCYNGALISRNVSVSGSEGARGYVETFEKEFRKLSDGTLQVTRRTKSWVRSGLTGKATGEPRESRTVELFPPVP